MSYIPTRVLSRKEVEKLADEAGMGSFARQALLEADFMDGNVRFLLVGDNQLVLQKIEPPDPED